jgi:histidinol-phosphate aminotransferase
MSWPSWLPLRDALRPLSAYGAPQVPAQASLNTNENPYSPSASLQKAITEAVSVVAADLNRYPDRDAIKLRTQLADYINELSDTCLLYTSDAADECEVV